MPDEENKEELRNIFDRIETLELKANERREESDTQRAGAKLLHAEFRKEQQRSRDTEKKILDSRKLSRFAQVRADNEIIDKLIVVGGWACVAGMFLAGVVKLGKLPPAEQGHVFIGKISDEVAQKAIEGLGDMTEATLGEALELLN